VPVWENPVYIDLALQAGRYLLLALLALFLWRKVFRPMLDSQTPDIASSPEPSPELQDQINRAAEAKRRASELNRHEENLEAARTMAQEDPRAVAMVVRSWMDKDGKN